MSTTSVIILNGHSVCNGHFPSADGSAILHPVVDLPCSERYKQSVGSVCLSVCLSVCSSFHLFVSTLSFEPSDLSSWFYGVYGLWPYRSRGKWKLKVVGQGRRSGSLIACGVLSIDRWPRRGCRWWPQQYVTTLTSSAAAWPGEACAMAAALRGNTQWLAVGVAEVQRLWAC